MPSSNQYKLLRNGGVRAGDALSPRSAGRSGRYVASVDVPTPNFEELGHRPFSEPDLLALAQLLQDPAWPRGAMNIYSLEGFLVALLVMPLGLRTRVWMPSIWNEPDCKTPLALQVRTTYDEFLELLFGFMRRLDAGFQESPTRFELVLGSTDLRLSRSSEVRAKDWVHGFGQALALCPHISLQLDTAARTALHAIASHAIDSGSPSKANGETRISIQQAVWVLARARTSRGPLGGFPAAVKLPKRSGAVSGSVLP
jgi:yecA family protein